MEDSTWSKPASMRPNRGIAGCPLSKDVLMLDPEVLFPKQLSYAVK
jgi:hypothetical protein